MLNQHQTIRNNIKKFNKPLPLAEYLIPFIGNKKEVKIADIGSGPYSIIGSYLDGVKVEICHSDSQDFMGFWDKYGAVPLVQIEYQNMEALTYPKEYFDIVHCANALDHTKNITAAISEMIRICKVGGWLWIECHLDQKDTGHKHFWNAKRDGVFTNGEMAVDLKQFGFKISYLDNGGESRYNKVIAMLKK